MVMRVVRTTIQLDKSVVKVLERLKRERDAKTYEDVIRALITESKRLERSERGSLPKLEEFRREKHDRLD